MYFLFADALVRSDLVEQIPNVAIICHEAPHLFGNVLRDYLLSIIMTYLNDSDNQVSDHTHISAYFFFFFHPNIMVPEYLALLFTHGEIITAVC